MQSACEELRRTGNTDPAVRRKYFEWTDVEGRTPLTLAAQRNYYQIVKLVSVQLSATLLRHMFIHA